MITAENDCLDFLFNNAGVAYGAQFREASLDNFEWLMNINYWGVVWCTKALLPLLEASPSGIWLTSRRFLAWWESQRKAPTTAKFAVRGFTESLQAEYRGTRSLLPAYTRVASQPILPARTNRWRVFRGQCGRAR